MTPEELIQLIRTCNLAQVRAELKAVQKIAPTYYQTLVKFYTSAKARKP